MVETKTKATKKPAAPAKAEKKAAAPSSVEKKLKVKKVKRVGNRAQPGR